MAKGSKKGACSSNTQPAKGGCLYHDRRNEEYDKVPGYVNQNLSGNNAVVFEDAMIADRKSIVPLVRAAEKLYSEKTKQKCQKSFAPFRESVLKIKADTTPEQLMKFKELAEKRTGWKCIGIYIHKDEGHAGSKYIEGSTDFAINYHAHVLWYCQNPDTGKAIPCTLKKLEGMQDDLAAATGMERGNKTGRRHRNVWEQRLVAMEERCSQYEEVLDKMQNEIKHLNVSKAIKERLLAIVGRSTADKELERQKAKETALRADFEKKLKAQANKYEEKIAQVQDEMRKVKIGKAIDIAATKANVVHDISIAAKLNYGTNDPVKVGKSIRKTWDDAQKYERDAQTYKPAYEDEQRFRTFAGDLLNQVRFNKFTDIRIRNSFENLCKSEVEKECDKDSVRQAVSGRTLLSLIRIHNVSKDDINKANAILDNMTRRLDYGREEQQQRTQTRTRGRGVS